MKNTRFVLIISATTCAWAADAQRGALVLEDQNCLVCHTVAGQGIGHEANPDAIDLAKRLTYTWSPAALASVLWNHTPAMWSDMSRKGVALPSATAADWADLFAYLYSQQVLALPADSRRGKEVLDGKHCMDCHAGSNAAARHEITPVSGWHVDDPVMLVYHMWDHAVEMTRETAHRKIAWQELTGRDLSDLTAYVRVLQHLVPSSNFSLPEPESGREPFDLNCAKCHQGTHALEVRLRNQAWMDIGAGMWNHAPRMLAVPVVPAEDMRKILAYVWELQYQGPEGNPERGHKAFNEKRCVACHSAAAGPRPGKTFTAFSMVALGWGPGRQMHTEMTRQGVAWPYLSPADVSNLVAYLNTLSIESAGNGQTH